MPSIAPRYGVSRRGSAVRADRAFALVLALGLVSSAILVALLAVIVPHAAHIATVGPDDLADVVILIVLVLATCGIALGSASIFRQLLMTVSLIRSLESRRIALPRSVAVLSRELAIEGRVDVVADERTFSFCYWFRDPRICLSSALVRRLSRDELRAVLVHERYHLRQRDPLRVVIARYFAAGLYVVPAVDELASFYALQKEIAADDEAVRSVGIEPLARALYKVLPHTPERELGLLVPVTGLSVTEARIDRLVSGAALPLRLSSRAVGLSTGALVGAVVLAAVRAGTSGAFETLPPLVAVPSLLLGPTSLLFAAALDGGAHQARILAGIVART